MTNPNKTYIIRMIMSGISVFGITMLYNQLFGVPLEGLYMYLVIIPFGLWSAHPFYPAAKQSFLRLVRCSTKDKGDV